MHCAGIVCEFDPFHNGHKYLLESVRKKGITHIVCAMSGDLTQRGDVAVADKQSRAQCAVNNGADLVVELPPPFCCSCSQVFAQGAVRLLKAAGADCIAFGSEVDDTQLLSECADISLDLENDPDVAAITADGLSYPRAVSLVIERKYGKKFVEVFSQPNATLAVEYIKAARALGINEFIAIKRKGTDHGSGDIVGSYAAAGTIRKMLRKELDVSSLTLLDMTNEQPAFIGRMETHILFTLCTADEQTLKSCPDINTQILESIMKMRKSAPSTLEELYISLKTKGVTLARLRRISVYLSAGLESISPDGLDAARVLAFNKRGTELLAAAKEGSVLFDTSLARIEERVPNIVQNIIKASYFRYLCTDREQDCINEYTRKITIERE